MPVTNKFHLPEPLVRAVDNDPYDGGDCDISTTRLISPPWMERLRRQHRGEITEDVVDRIWALIGQSAHAVLERAAGQGDIVEKRYYVDVDKKTLSGQIDLLTEKGELIDHKITSVWSIKDMLANGVKPEYLAQLNVNAYLAKHNGEKVESLWIFAVARDWRPIEYIRYDDYPPRAVMIRAELWPMSKADDYVRDRIKMHFDETPEPCTSDERWERPTTWAVMKKGRKSALRVLPSWDEAETWKDENGGDAIEERPGESVRCASYCSVSSFCSWWKEQGK